MQTSKTSASQTELEAAQAQVIQILKAKAALEHENAKLKHDMGGMIGYLSAQRSRLEMLGVPLGPPAPNVKLEATLLMNAAVEAAHGKAYLPCAEAAALRKQVREADATIAKLQEIVNSGRIV